MTIINALKPEKKEGEIFMKTKITFLIVLVIIIFSLFANYIDTANVTTGHEPRMCIKFKDENNGKVTYIGLGYKVIRYVKNDVNEPYSENVGVKKGSYFMKYDKPENDGIDISRLTVKDALSYLPEKQYETIINPDNPKIEEIIFDKEPSVYLFDENTTLKGRKVIKYTYNTTLDGLLGPITFYTDKETGFILGSDYRE